jgi:RNA polymerase sigma factor (sigma-70 family)
MAVQADRETREATELAELYRANATELTRFATMLVGPGRAEDVVADATARVLATVPVATVTNLRAYLYRAVLNQSRRTLQSDAARQRRERRFVASHTLVPVAEPDDEVGAAVAELSDRQRAVVFFAYWQDLEPRAIAELLGISEGAVRRHLARARARLRRTLVDGSP